MILLHTTRTKVGKYFLPFPKFACSKTTTSQNIFMDFIIITFLKKWIMIH